MQDTVSDSTNICVSYGSVDSLLRVELPVIQQNLSKAVASVGGDSALTEVSTDPSHQLHYSTKDGKGSLALGSSLTNKNGLLIRLRRRKSQPEHTECEVLGAIQHSHAFTSLADYKVRIFCRHVD